MSAGVVEMPPLRGAAPLGDQLRHAIQEAILDGTLPAGARLHPDELAAHFDVSRIPIREALRALDATGWVEIRARHGVYVRQRDERELEELFEVRAPLEAQACRLAARRRTDTDLDGLDALAQEAIAAADDPQRFATLNSRFHAAITTAAANQVLATTLDGLRLRVQWYFAAAPPQRPQASAQEHLELVAAIRAQDGDRAAELAEAHVLTTLQVLRERVATSADPEGSP